MSFSRRQLEAFGETLGDSVTRREGGRVIYGGGGSSGPSSQTVYQTNIPDYARPYVEDMLGRAAATADQAFNPYQQYMGERVAQFSPLQQQSYAAAQGMTTPEQIQQASQAAQGAVTAAQGLNYTPTQFSSTYNAPSQYSANQFQNRFAAPETYQPGQITNTYNAPAAYSTGQFQNQFNAPQAYEAGQFSSQQVDPNTAALRQYQMGPAERVGTGAFTDPGTVESYMSPYMRNVMDVEKREAARQSRIQQQQTQAQAVGQGAYGGSRSAIVEAERQRNLEEQMGDIETRGLQAAYDRAGQLYGTDAARQLQAAQANQQAGLTTGAQNLQALLGVQQLGAGQNLQAQLANQQAGLQTQQMRESSRQFGAQQGLTAAQLQAQFGLSAQQAQEASRQFGAQQAATAAQLQAQYGMTAQQANEASRQFAAGQQLTAAQLQAQYGLSADQASEASKQFAAQQAANSAQLQAQFGLSAQQAAEASRQFGANMGLQGINAQLQGAGLLGTLGQQQFGQQMGIANLQNLYGSQQQQQVQNILNQQYQDSQNYQNYPYRQLGFLSDMLRGLPLTQQSSTIYGGQPSTMQQLAGLGMAGYGMMRAKGGTVDSGESGGLADLLIAKMA